MLNNNLLLIIAGIVLLVFLSGNGVQENFWLWNSYAMSSHRYHYPPYAVSHLNYLKYAYNPFYYKSGGYWNPYKTRRYYFNIFHRPNLYRKHTQGIGYQYNSPVYSQADPHMKSEIGYNTYNL